LYADPLENGLKAKTSRGNKYDTSHSCNSLLITECYGFKFKKLLFITICSPVKNANTKIV